MSAVAEKEKYVGDVFIPPWSAAIYLIGYVSLSECVGHAFEISLALSGLLQEVINQ